MENVLEDATAGTLEGSLDEQPDSENDQCCTVSNQYFSSRFDLGIRIWRDEDRCFLWGFSSNSSISKIRISPLARSPVDNSSCTATYLDTCNNDPA
eukprot:3264383-Pleurochrysis_carterae.AAC.1